jgi:lysozyme
MARRSREAPADPVAFTNGIDVSHHQQAIDWAAVAAAGIRYAFIKATQGAGSVDRRFVENWRGAALNGIVRGAYHFFDPEADPESQFENFSAQVTLEAGDLAPVVDLEIDGQDWDALAQKKRVPAALALLELLEAHYGITPIIYTNRRSVNEVFGGKPGDLTTYPLWVASFKQNPPPTMPPGWTTWVHWQQSDKGSVKGISTPVDLDRCVGDPGPVLTPAPVLAAARALAVAPATAAAAVPGPVAIDVSGPLSEKVPALWTILGRVAGDLDAAGSAAKQRMVKTFLLHLAGHESQLRTRQQDAGGPARSLFQFEAHRAKDAGAHVQTLKLMGTLAAATGNTTADLAAGFNALPAFNPPHPAQSAFFPTGNLIESRLLDNDLFAAYLVRIDFRRFAAPIPATNADQAAYWLQFWKVSAPDPEAAKKQFLQDCDRVDPFIPTT